MFKPVSGQSNFDSKTLTKFPYNTNRYWLHRPMIDEIEAWAMATAINGIYVVEKSMSKGVLYCAFAFKTEAELGIFDLTFYNKLMEDQKNTRIYKLFKLIDDTEQLTGKKIF